MSYTVAKWELPNRRKGTANTWEGPQILTGHQTQILTGQAGVNGMGANDPILGIVGQKPNLISIPDICHFSPPTQFYTKFFSTQKRAKTDLTKTT